MVVWKIAGFTMIILLTGLQAIPSELTEAARIDGAGRWQRFRHLTLPLMRKTIALALIVSVTGSILAFDQFYIMTSGGPQNKMISVVYYIFNPVLRVVQSRLWRSAVDRAARHPGGDQHRAALAASRRGGASMTTSKGTPRAQGALGRSRLSSASASPSAIFFLAPFVITLLVVLPARHGGQPRRRCRHGRHQASASMPIARSIRSAPASGST